MNGQRIPELVHEYTTVGRQNVGQQRKRWMNWYLRKGNKPGQVIFCGGGGGGGC
jgi:hypothetical protein